MYDAVLISTHYDYLDDGTMIPSPSGADGEDLSMTIPLGIVHIAQYLHDCGMTVRVVHIPHEMQAIRRFGIDPADIENPLETLLKKYPARVCGIQAHWYLYCGGAIYIADIYKQLFPDSRVYFGGAMATAYWQAFLTAARGADGVVLGEGERTFRTIVEKSLSPHFDGHTISGLAFRSGNGRLVYNPAGADSFLGLDELPTVYPDAPPFVNLFWQNRYFIHTSRGLCPEPCAYCVANNKTLHGRPFQTLAIDRILTQIQVFSEYGIDRIFLGENQFLSAPFMRTLIDAIVKENFPLIFELETHPVMFENDALLEQMVRANFLRFTMGCESGSPEVLKRIGRTYDARQILDSVGRITEKGAVVLTAWIGNLPGESASEFQQTLSLLRRVADAGGFVYWIENLHVLPGSKLYEDPERWGIELLQTDLAHWVKWSRRSKRYVDFDDVYQAPENYLTHINRAMAPNRMIDRFYALRKLARVLVPRMKSTLVDRSGKIPQDLFQSEMDRLDWYASRGWKLWLI